MEKVLLNTLYLMHSSGGYAHLDNETLRLERDKKTVARIPLHHLASIVANTETLLSPALLRECGQRRITVTWMDRNNQYAGSFRPPTHGNVLLRIAQFEAHQSTEKTNTLIQTFVRGKLRNARHTLAKRSRESQSPEAKQRLLSCKEEIDRILKSADQNLDPDSLRGYEGQAAKLYFSVFQDMLKTQEEYFRFDGRTKRPPLSPMNALLSFASVILSNECRGALEGVGLDPQIGFSHTLRPGRPSLALDLVEEFRHSIIDRFLFRVINQQQLRPEHFDHKPGGAVLLNDEGRKAFFEAYQKRKHETVQHPLMQERVPVGLLPHLQARILARHLRGELDAYLPFEYR